MANEPIIDEPAAASRIGPTGVNYDQYPASEPDDDGKVRDYLYVPPGVAFARLQSRDGVGDWDAIDGGRVLKIDPSRDLAAILIALGAALESAGLTGQQQRLTAAEAKALLPIEDDPAT